MSRVDGPVSMTARINLDIGSGIKITYETEFVVIDETEAREKGEQFKGLVDAFNEGYGRAT